LSSYKLERTLRGTLTQDTSTEDALNAPHEQDIVPLQYLQSIPLHCCNTCQSR
jgi:hypothetical protein